MAGWLVGWFNGWLARTVVLLNSTLLLHVNLKSKFAQHFAAA
jgi:hypothetical protein